MAEDQAVIGLDDSPLWAKGIASACATIVPEIQPHTEYQTRPLDWIVAHLGVPRETLVWSELEGYDGHEWDGTPEPLVAILEAIAEGRDVGAEAGTGVGKTFLVACILYWFLGCHENAIVVTTAPKEPQLKLHLWKEVGALFPRFQRHFPQATLLDGKLRMKPAVEDRETWAATAFVAGIGADESSATKAQGFHAEHMLWILEEMPGLHRAMTTAIENTCTGDHNPRIALGNPDSREDELHRFCLQPTTTHVRISALDHPNLVTGRTVVPGAVGQAAVERRRRLYAHTPALYDSRVRGISPEQAHGVALKVTERNRKSWPAAAVHFAVTSKGWPAYLGLDFGLWRFAGVWALADMAKGLHVVKELFSQRETIGVRAEKLAEQWVELGSPAKVKAWGDPANAQDRLELNSALKRLKVPWRVIAAPRGPVKVANRDMGQRLGAVTRLDLMLGHGTLTIAKELEQGPEWRLGQDTTSEGEPMRGSRLLWELRNWRYPDPREGQAQKQDPDDDTADGADMVAALRYLVMGWWKEAPPPGVKPKVNPNVDQGLERLITRLAREERILRRQRL